MFFLTCCALVCLYSNFTEATGDIRTLKAVGNGVITATVNLIENSCIFRNDHQFFRRLAFQESQFGYMIQNSKDPDAKWNGFGKGGIWQVDDHFFNKSQKYVSNNPSLNQNIMTTFGVNFTNLSYVNNDLWVPLNAGIVGRVRLSILNSQVPIPISLQGQADYWNLYYNKKKGNSTAQHFLDNVAIMNRLYACKSKGVDLLFILDASGSVGAGPFANSLSFIAAVAGDLDIGESAYKIAVDVFSRTARNEIKFNGYTDVDDLVAKITGIYYDDDNTNMAEAFEQAVDSFSTANGARDPSYGYAKVAILITDGKPTGCNSSQHCSAQSAAAVAHLRNADIELYTVGVGSNIDSSWLKNEIASAPKCLHADELVDYRALAEYYPNQLRERACLAVAIVPQNQTVVQNSLTVNQSLNFQITVDINAGVTLNVEMDSGEIDLYASKTVRTPSAEIHDYHAKATEDDRGQIYISPAELRQKSQTLPAVENDDSNTTLPVFVSIIGSEGNGSFIMHVESGNAVDETPQSKLTSKFDVLRAVIYSGVGLVVLMILCNTRLSFQTKTSFVLQSTAKHF